MKVLLVNSTFGRSISGSGHHVYLLYKYLRDKIDFEVWNTNNVGYINVPKLKSISFYLIMRMKSIPSDVDVIHVHNPKFSGLFKAKNNESKSVLTIHGDYILEAALQYGLLSKPLIWYMNQQVGRADIITCVSPYWSMKRGWVWIPNMIELKAIEKIEPADEKYVLFVGRNDPIKNYPMFKKIAKRIYKELGLKSLALGIRRGNLEYLKHDIVEWEQVISYMKSAHALIITSSQEGFPTVLLEAWASGCPVLAHDIPSLRALHELYRNSLLLFDSVECAVKQFRNVLEGLHDELRTAGLRTVKYFDASEVHKQYYALYKHLTIKGGEA